MEGDPQFNVQFTTTADTSGADQEKAALDAVTESAAAANAAASSGRGFADPTLGAELRAQMAGKLLTAEELITAQEEAQAELNAKLVAQEEAKLAAAEAQSKVYGRPGLAGNLLKNFGVDANTAATVGLGILAFTEIDRLVTEVSKHLDEERINAEKASAEFSKQVDQWKEMAATAKSMEDVVKVTQSVNSEVDKLVEKMRTLPSEGAKDTVTNLADGFTLLTRGITGYAKEAADSVGVVAGPLVQLIANMNGVKTSTEDAQQQISGQIAQTEKAGQTFERYAQSQAKWMQSLSAMPVADQLKALIEKEVELIEKQKGVAEGTKLWNLYQKQIDEVKKSEGAAMETQNKNIETLQKLDEQITKLTSDLPKLEADLADMQKSGNDFVQITSENIGGIRTTGYYRKPDTVTDAGGNVVPAAGAQPLAANDPALVAFQQLTQKLTDLTQKIADDQTKKAEVQEQTTGAPQPSTSRPPLSDADLQQRTQQNEKSLDDEAKKIEDASKENTDKAAESLTSAATNFNELPPHFDTFRTAIQQGTDAIAAKTSDATDAFQALSNTTVTGFQAILQVMANQQKQIANLTDQISNLS